MVTSKNQFLIIMYGVTGSGKSFIAKNLANKLPNCIAIHSAVVRRKYPELIKDIGTFQFDFDGKKCVEVYKKTYSKMWHLAERALKRGKNVILDGCHIYRWERRGSYNVAQKMKIPFFVLECIVEDKNILKNRILGREKSKHSFAEASELITLRKTMEYRKKELIENDYETLNVNPKVIQFNTITHDINLRGPWRKEKMIFFANKIIKLLKKDEYITCLCK